MRQGMATPPDARRQSLTRLGRIEGQIRGIARMVETDRYCVDIITQIAAARAALKRVSDELLQDHVAHCVEDAIESGNRKEQRTKVTELLVLLGKLST